MFVQKPKTTTWDKVGSFDYHDANVKQVQPEALEDQKETTIQIPWILIIIGLIVLVVLWKK